MSREQHVEDSLSAYLDNALTQEERVYVTAHIQTCSACNELLTDFRRFDALLIKQPRVSPSPALREQLFSSPEYLELIGETANSYVGQRASTVGLQRRQTDTSAARRPHLVALPNKRTSSRIKQETKARIPVTQHRDIQLQRFMQVMIAACLLLTLGVGSLVGWRFLAHRQTAGTPPGITPPQGPRQGGPLPAGVRFVFLRDGSLWSEAEDGSVPASRLTPATVTVAPAWMVRPALANRVAGNMLAYIDEKQGYIHVVRTDGQNDTIIKQPLVRVSSITAWNSTLGTTLLHGLSWSPDGSTLAFLAAPVEVPTLYLYSIGTNGARAVALPQQGLVSHVSWSPNGVRIAFELTTASDATTARILDYNMQTGDMLASTATITTPQHPDDTLLSLDWSPNNALPTLTWSAGTAGHIHSIWMQHVGVAAPNKAAQQLLGGDYTQAVYSRVGLTTGSWLLCRHTDADTTSLSVLTLMATSFTLANGGKQISTLAWTPDGKRVAYLDMFDANTGTLHTVDIATANNVLVADGVRATPAPLWSLDGKRILFDAGTHSFVADTNNTKTQFALQGSAFLWSATMPQAAIVSTNDNTSRVYLVDTQRGIAKTLDAQDIAGSIVWTQIP